MRFKRLFSASFAFAFRLIEPQEEFTFEYDIRDDHPSGTFWYHPHKHGSVAYQWSNGVAGALIVERPKNLKKDKPAGDVKYPLRSNARRGSGRVKRAMDCE